MVGENAIKIKTIKNEIKFKVLPMYSSSPLEDLSLLMKKINK